jgi:hypothetical protein
MEVRRYRTYELRMEESWEDEKNVIKMSSQANVNL